MRPEEILQALFEPSLNGGQGEAAVIRLYSDHLLELEREEVYDYFHENREALIAELPKPQQKAHFVYGVWAVAPPEHWSDWAKVSPDFGSEEMDEDISWLLNHLLRRASELEPGAIRSVPAHLEAIAAALRRLHEDDRIAAAAETALEGRDWWIDDQAAEVQLALHELVRAVEAAAPGLQETLAQVRAKDLLRAPLEEPLAVRTAVALAEEFDNTVYRDLEGKLPEPDVEQRPLLYAEAAVARAALAVRDLEYGAISAKVKVHLARLRILAKLGEYSGQVRSVARNCLALSPSVAQLELLSYYLGPNLSPQATTALGRWREASNRRDRAAAITRLIRPRFDAARWAAILSEEEYTEAGVIKKLSAKLLEDGSRVEDRRQMAGIMRGLHLRTQSARDETAELIVRLLDSKPKANLSVALILCEGLGPDHRRSGKLKRAFERYARRHSRKYTPQELKAIGGVGVEISSKHLSKGARKRSEEIVGEGLKAAGRLAKSAASGLRVG
jgi:hypothetical protein